MAFGSGRKMDISLTDASHVSKERGLGRAFLSADDKLKAKYAAHGTIREDRLTLVLRSVGIDRLKSALADQIEQLNTDAALRVSAELTSRGIAPCFCGNFRDDEWLRTFWSAVEPILLLIDLQWIVARYPKHTPEWQRLNSVFDPKKFWQTAEYLRWDGRRSAGQVAKAMGLSEQQQRECLWIQCLHVERWRKRLVKRLTIAQGRIESSIREGDKRPIEAQNETIKRRCDLWLCAELGEWKAQRTAHLYAMMTGNTLPRNVVAKQLQKLPRVRRTEEDIVL